MMTFEFPCPKIEHIYFRFLSRHMTKVLFHMLFHWYFIVPPVYRLKKVPSKCLEEKVVSATEMHAMEMKCCLQRLQMASYLRHKSDWRPSYPNPLVCHAVHKSTDFRPQEFEIRLRYKDNSMITVQIFYKTTTECLLRIL